MTTYAVESYNSETGIFSRHDTGSKEEMESLTQHLILQDVSNNETDSYYRVNEITDEDERIWDLQVSSVPDMENKDRVFGEWTQINSAARYLGVTFGRVFNMVSDGVVKASTTKGRNKLVSVEDIVNRRIAKPKAGRPKEKQS